MTFTLAPDELTDGELVDLIGRGDPSAAARFWVRHWPTALSAARGLVEPAEVPGLAAEALVGTLAAIRVGSGPADHAAVFVIDAVHELGGDEYSASFLPAVAYPDVFPSRTLAAAFAALRVEDQQLLWAALADGVPDEEVATAVGITAAEAAISRDTLLGVLQESYVRRHRELAVEPDCAAAHSFLGSAISHPATAFPSETWRHLSECVVCTEAFHELAHTPVDLGPLLGAAAFPGALPELLPVPAAPGPAEVVPPVLAVTEPEPDAGPDTGSTAALFPDGEAETVSLLAATPAYAEAVEPVTAAAAGFEPESTTKHADERRRRPLAFALGAAVLAGVIALTVSLLGGGTDPTSPSAAADNPSSTPTTNAATPTENTTPEGLATTAVAPPLATDVVEDPTTSASTAGADPTPSATPTKKTTKKATQTSTKSPTSAPSKSSSASPTSSPTTPTPSATPTKSCNGLQHLLGFC